MASYLFTGHKRWRRGSVPRSSIHQHSALPVRRGAVASPWMVSSVGESLQRTSSKAAGACGGAMSLTVASTSASALLMCPAAVATLGPRMRFLIPHTFRSKQRLAAHLLEGNRGWRGSSVPLSCIHQRSAFPVRHGGVAKAWQRRRRYGW